MKGDPKLTDEHTLQWIIKLPREDVTRFEEIHPEHGARTWFVRECLSRYNSLYDSIPVDNIDEVVQSVFESSQTKVRERER